MITIITVRNSVTNSSLINASNYADRGFVIPLSIFVPFQSLSFNLYTFFRDGNEKDVQNERRSSDHLASFYCANLKRDKRILQRRDIC